MNIPVRNPPVNKFEQVANRLGLSFRGIVDQASYNSIMNSVQQQLDNDLMWFKQQYLMAFANNSQDMVRNNCFNYFQQYTPERFLEFDRWSYPFLMFSQRFVRTDIESFKNQLSQAFGLNVRSHPQANYDAELFYGALMNRCC
jgi:hypothetical protein